MAPSSHGYDLGQPSFQKRSLPHPSPPGFTAGLLSDSLIHIHILSAPLPTCPRCVFPPEIIKNASGDSWALPKPAPAQVWTGSQQTSLPLP